ncbi:uncharacterized protein LOC34624315 [Cyclospora cayetanensis]|uniref:Uncharacterized protein LOC34624315 n=1 Tax=Cyclospora cayetanensis TaxID=88456 RepID=A0A6P6RXJ3_9EIME|nr:uncharacterized protein LOC34624315 [Cyclospora cayetanensis]
MGFLEMGGGSLRGGPPSGKPAESPALPLRGGSLPESPESSCAWIQDFVKGVGWSEEQGRRAEMEDGMLVVRGFGGQRGAWLFGVYDGHGGRQTVEFLLQHLHANIRSEVLSRAARRREELIRREGREWVSLVKSAVDQSTRGGVGVEGEEGGGLLPLPAPLALCSQAEVEAALVAAFKATDEQLLRAGVRESGSTACVCLLHPRVSLSPCAFPRRLFPEDGSARSCSPHSAESAAAAADSSALESSRSERNGCRGANSPSASSSQEVCMDLHAAHLGDTRVLLVYTNGSCRRLTDASDHKASAPREAERVEALGGFVIGERVNGMLAIGRAFGDWSLKLGPMASPALLGKGRQLIVSNVPDVQTESFVSVARGEEEEEEREQTLRLHPQQKPSKHTRLVSAAEETAADSGAARRASRKVVSARQQHLEPALLILGCDGLFDVIDDAAAASFALGVVKAVAAENAAASASEAAEAAARALMHEAVGLRMSSDNVSIVVCVLQSMEELAAAAASSSRNSSSSSSSSNSSSNNPRWSCFATFMAPREASNTPRHTPALREAIMLCRHARDPVHGTVSERFAVGGSDRLSGAKQYGASH